MARLCTTGLFATNGCYGCAVTTERRAVCAPIRSCGIGLIFLAIALRLRLKRWGWRAQAFGSTHDRPTLQLTSTRASRFCWRAAE